jgi:hypothetical protein
VSCSLLSVQLLAGFPALPHGQPGLLARLSELLDVALPAHRSSPPCRAASRAACLGPPIRDQLVGKVSIRCEVGAAPARELDGGQSLRVWIVVLGQINHDRSLLTEPPDDSAYVPRNRSIGHRRIA